MTVIEPGRATTASSDDDITVFLIGMRFNQPLRVRQWAPVFVAMPRVLAHLDRHPDVGMLGSHLWLGRTTMLLSYWRSPEHLQRFAADADAPHAEPWRTFQRRAHTTGAVGIYHETYVTHAGERETVYVDMPAFGLAGATQRVPVGAGLRTARQRMRAGASDDPVTITTGATRQ